MYMDHLPVRFTQEEFKEFFEAEGYDVTLETQSTYMYAILKKNSIKQQVHFGDYGLEVGYSGQVKRLSTLLKRINTKQYAEEEQHRRNINGKTLLSNFKKAFELTGIDPDKHTISNNFGSHGISGASATIFLAHLSSNFTNGDRLRCSISEKSVMSYTLTTANFDNIAIIDKFVKEFEENFIATSL